MVEPVLEVVRLEKRFGALAATDRVSLDLRPGEIHALIGPNGAGKSTLIKLVTGELVPDAGRVRFLGRDVGGIDVAGRARMGLARTFQVSSVASDFTVLQNVALAVMGASGRTFGFLRPAMTDRILVDAAMGCVQAANLAGREGVRAAELSHGERRRLEIAMALALKPKALLLDEPMAGMGAEGAGELGQLLARLKKTAPILLVEHDMDAVFRLSDRISVMSEGRVIASGRAEAIRAHAEVRRVYLGDPV
jgi:branched-chain amino acid transport system ATP-binding protein